MRELTVAERQWLFDRAALDETPSREDGISFQDELQRRNLVIENIRSLGMRAGLGPEGHHTAGPVSVMPIAAVLVHRFYMRRSFKDFGEKLLAPTILFLACKIGEESLKLRHIVNSCLAKWEANAVQWEPNPNDKDNYPPQSPEYRRWEREILATEELALEALCFNMAFEDPWVVIRRCLHRLRDRPTKPEEEPKVTGESEQNGDASKRVDGLFDSQGRSKGDSRLSEGLVLELARAVFNLTCQSPLVVTAHPTVLAMTLLSIIISVVDQVPLSEGITAAAVYGKCFGLDLLAAEGADAETDDLRSVREACDQFIEYCELGLIDPGLVKLIKK